MMTEKVLTKLVGELLFFEGTYGSRYDINEVEPDSEMSEAELENFWKQFDSRLWRVDLAKEYILALNGEIADLAKDRYDLSLTEELSFESVTSPKEYNFETDRIFVYVPQKLLQRFHEYAVTEKAKFSDYLKAKFTDRPGFISYYDPDVELWLKKPLEGLNHIEVGAFMEFFMFSGDAEERERIEESIYDGIRGNTDLLSIY